MSLAIEYGWEPTGTETPDLEWLRPFDDDWLEERIDIEYGWEPAGTEPPEPFDDDRLEERTDIEHGWEPTGTEPPNLEWLGPFDDDWLEERTARPLRSWDGNYFTNDFQRVTDADARALGEALLRAVAAMEAQERESPTKWPGDWRPTEWPNDWVGLVRRFAHSALKEGFAIR